MSPSASFRGSSRAALVAAMLLVVASTLPSASALSWPACESGAPVWVTRRPFTGPQFPGADLFFFCRVGPNINGAPIDVCSQPGSAAGDGCNPAAVADAYCAAIGYDKAASQALGGWASGPANASTPAVTLSGEFCLRKGVYAPSRADASALLANVEGEPCQVLTQVACIRSIDTVRASLASAGVKLADAPAPAPDVEPVLSASVDGGNSRKLLLPQ